MMNSTLISVSVPSPNHSGKRKYDVTRITPHCVVGQCTAKSLGEYFENRNLKASSNYGIGYDGRIGVYVDEENRSWCSSNEDNDNRAITIECASETVYPYKMTDAVYKSLIDLCVDICRRHNKNTLIWFPNKTMALKYKLGKNEMLLTVHRWFANTECCGDWLFERLGALANTVTDRLQEQTNDKLYRVQVGAFKKKENAEALAKKLKDLGFDSFIV